MPIQSIERIMNGNEEIGIRLNGVGKDGFFEVLYADIPGNSWNVNRLRVFTERAQALIDVRIPLTDPMFKENGIVVDPAALTDPARPDFFWNNGDLVARPVIISGVSWDGSRLLFTLARAQ